MYARLDCQRRTSGREKLKIESGRLSRNYKFNKWSQVRRMGGCRDREDYMRKGLETWNNMTCVRRNKAFWTPNMWMHLCRFDELMYMKYLEHACHRVNPPLSVSDLVNVIIVVGWGSLMWQEWLEMRFER